MALTREFIQTIEERAAKDPKFFKELVKEVLKEALKIDPEILERVYNKVKDK